MVKIKSKPKRWGFGTNRPINQLTGFRRYKSTKPWLAYIKKHLPKIKFYKNHSKYPRPSASKISKRLQKSYTVMRAYGKYRKSRR